MQESSELEQVFYEGMDIWCERFNFSFTDRTGPDGSPTHSAEMLQWWRFFSVKLKLDAETLQQVFDHFWESDLPRSASNFPTPATVKQYVGQLRARLTSDAPILDDGFVPLHERSPEEQQEARAAIARVKEMMSQRSRAIAAQASGMTSMGEVLAGSLTSSGLPREVWELPKDQINQWLGDRVLRNEALAKLNLWVNGGDENEKRQAIAFVMTHDDLNPKHNAEGGIIGVDFVRQRAAARSG